MRGATGGRRGWSPKIHGFNPRAPCGARRGFPIWSEPQRVVSTHAPRAGRDSWCSPARPVCILFQPTRPVRGATYQAWIENNPDKVSTHAPRAGRDKRVRSLSLPPRSFNPRAPCGARLVDAGMSDAWIMFQPTRPVRGATVHAVNIKVVLQVSTHAPRAGRDFGSPIQISISVRVSTHAPRAGRDVPVGVPSALSTGFNPRAPCGARPPPHSPDARR